MNKLLRLLIPILLVLLYHSDLSSQSLKTPFFRADDTSWEVIIQEDFSNFKEGSEESPDVSNIADAYSGKISEDKTITPGWIGGGVHEAGTVCYLCKFEMYGTYDGFIQTPKINLEGNLRVSFRARSSNPALGRLNVILMDKTKDNPIKADMFELTSEWNEYSLEVNVQSEKGYDEGFVKFVGEEGKYLDLFIDDIKIEHLKEESTSTELISHDGKTLIRDGIKIYSTIVQTIYIFDMSGHLLASCHVSEGEWVELPPHTLGMLIVRGEKDVVKF